MAYTIHNPKQWNHLKDVSVYNHNYYQNPETGEIIFEECWEEYDSCDYFLVDENLNVIQTLGSLYCDTFIWEEENDIELLEYFY